MLPARRYWARFLLSVVLGCIIGLMLGMVAEGATATPGYGVFAAAAGAVAGLVFFMLVLDS